MIGKLRRWSIARQIGWLVAIALLLMGGANLLVTFAGPPPFVAPFRLVDAAKVLQGESIAPEHRRAVVRIAASFAPHGGEERRTASEEWLAVELGRDPAQVRVAAADPLRLGPDHDPGLAMLTGSASIGVRLDSARWKIVSIPSPPLFGAWHAMTLGISLVLAALLWLAAALVVQGIVRPIRRLAAEADCAYVDGQRGEITIAGPPEVAHLAATLARMRDDLAALIDNRTLMLAAIAHDMAAPLSRLQFQIAKLRGPARSSAEDDLAELSAMIASILDFAAGDRGLRHEQVNLAAIIDRCAGNSPLLALGALPDDVPVLGDRLALQRLIGNLASNACRYAGGGTFALCLDSEAVELTLEDSGPGFDPALAERLFEPFFRVDASRNRAEAGIGLGLATARAIALAHKGSLTATNRAGGGAIFRLILPRAA